ncbi:MAG TPA: hypothetical protein VGY58_13580, partial [Gemmataceae bacterium]|nr:hypothetical protein [Gemmataceae bacterium]
FAALFAGAALPSAGFAQDDLQRFLNAVPASTNTITVIRMQNIMHSPLARREGWAKKRELEYHEGTALFPPTSDVVVIASKLVPGDLAHSPTVALIPMEKPIADKDLADREHGSIRPVGGEFVVLSSRNCYMVTKGKYLAIVSPPDRQEMAQWIRFVKKNREPAFTQYLQDAIAAAATAGLAVAIDTEDILDPRLLRFGCEHCDTLSGERKADRVAVNLLLTKLKGARLSVQFDDAITGTLRLDFTDKVGKEGLLLKPFLKEMLGEIGAEIDDFTNGEITLEENAVLIKGNATLSGLRRLLSLVLPPLPKVDTTRRLQTNEPVAKPELSPEEKTARATLAYFQNVNSMLAELQKKNKTARDYARTIVWHESYAKKIQHLPTDYVDPEMQQYGVRAHNRLVGLADSLRGVAVQVQSLETGLTATMFVGPSYRTLFAWNQGAPSAQFDSNLQQIRTMQAEHVAAGAGDRLKIWNMIYDDNRATAQKMSTKYKLSFPELTR